MLFLVGGLMLLAALQGRRDRTLLWMSGALLLGGAGFVVSTARGIPDWRDPVIVLSNMLLITGYACILTSLRSYVGRPMRVWVLLAGAAVWFALCLWPWFLASDVARLLVFFPAVDRLSRGGGPDAVARTARGRGVGVPPVDRAGRPRPVLCLS